MDLGAGREWFSERRWVSAPQNGASATVTPLDVPPVTLGSILRGTWPTEVGERPGTIFSCVMNNCWIANSRPEQGGHFRFRYVVMRARSTRGAHLSWLGWEETTPLEIWKPAQDGTGTTLRFLDLGGATRTVSLQSPLVNLQQAWRTDAVEKNQNQLSLHGSDGFQFTVHPDEIVSVRIFGKSGMQMPIR
jgi:hypothetical protein